MTKSLIAVLFLAEMQPQEKSFLHWLWHWTRDHGLWKLLEMVYEWTKDHWKSNLGGTMLGLIGSLYSRFQWHLHWPYLVMIGGGIFAFWITAVEQRERQKNREKLAVGAASSSSIITPDLPSPTPAIPADTRVLIDRIDFHYLPEGSLLEHGWALTTEEQPGILPNITALRDETISARTIISLETRGWYALDYMLPFVSVYDSVRFTARFADGGVLYLKFRVWTPEGKARVKWLAQLPVGGTVPHGDGSIEWKISNPTKVLPNGWILFDLSLQDQTQATFGTSKYQLLGVRVRGSLAISSIEFFGPSTSTSTTTAKLGNAIPVTPDAPSCVFRAMPISVPN